MKLCDVKKVYNIKGHTENTFYSEKFLNNARVNLRIQSKYRKIQTREMSVF